MEESRSELVQLQQYLKEHEERDPLLAEVANLKEQNKNLHLALIECISQQREGPPTAVRGRSLDTSARAGFRTLNSSVERSDKRGFSSNHQARRRRKPQRRRRRRDNEDGAHGGAPPAFLNLSSAHDTAGLARENTELRKKVQRLERLVESDSLERYKFMEGAVWCCRRVLRDVETLSVRCKEVVTECNSNMDSISSSGSFKKAVNWAIDTVLIASEEAHESINKLM